MKKRETKGTRETATILAALRHYQRTVGEQGAAMYPDHFTMSGQAPLTLDQIDDLCEEINCGERSQENPALRKFVSTISRMSKEDEFVDAPASEDWIATLNSLIAEARELVPTDKPQPDTDDTDEECCCADNSWYGPEHGSDCSFAGQPNAGSLVTKKAISITDEKFTDALDELLNHALKLTFPFLTKHNVSDIVAEVKRHFHTHLSTELSVINGVLPNDEVDLANQTVLGLRDSFKALRRK